MNMKLPTCPNHPGIFLPANLTCPLCAQERRRAAYEAQRREIAKQLPWAVQGLLKPGKRQSGEDT